MVRLIRISTAVALALALVTVPVLADWCAASCESALAAASNGAPACHHETAPAPRIGHVPAPCSHDHHPIVVDAATTVVLRAVLAISACDASVDNVIARVVAEAHEPAHPASDSPPLPLMLATILRV